MTDQLGKCPYCFHAFHGVADLSKYAHLNCKVHLGLNFDFTNSKRIGLCNEPDPRFGTYCNCDGKTQWWEIKAATPDDALSQARRAVEAGYMQYVFDGGQFVIQRGGQPQEKTSYWLSIVYSDTLPPVTSRQEFEQRIGL
jgi:hypothetical protein